MEIRKVVRDGKVAVLVSPGLGEGWSTWADKGFKEFALFDHCLVELKENGGDTDAAEALIERILSNKETDISQI